MKSPTFRARGGSETTPVQIQLEIASPLKRNCHSMGITLLKPTMSLARIARNQLLIAAFHKTNSQLRAHVLQRHSLCADDGWRDDLATVTDKDLAQLVEDVREWVASSSY